MNRRGAVTVGQAVLLVVGVIFAIAMLGAIINSQHQMTGKMDVNGETLDISNAVLVGGTINTTYQFNVTNENTGWKLSESQCAISGFVIGNGSDNFTVTTDYVFSTTYGNLTLKDTTTMNLSGTNTTYLYYEYCDDGYNKDSSSRSIAGLISLFAVLAIVAFVTFGIREWIK